MSDRREFRDLASPAELRETIAGLDLDVGTETVPLADARGRVLAERVDAGIDVPGFDRAAMDGYAVRAADTFGASEHDPVLLDVVGSVHAGERPDVDLDAGAAVEISTGAVMPADADAVVMVEETSERDAAGSDADEGVGSVVEIRVAVAPGEHVMAAGADIAAGQRALGPGTLLTPREIGLLSALGVDEVPVREAPTVAVISTGDELVPAGETLDHGAGEIHDVNAPAIAAGVRDAGGEPVVYERVGDDEVAMTETIVDAAASCDLVLTSGSTSASAMDVVYRVVEDRGERLLHGAAVKPGKPTIVGTIEGTAYVGLPGYPVSALSIFRTFVAPLIRGAAGQPAPQTATVNATMATRERAEEGRMRLVAVGLVDDGVGETLAYSVDKGSGATTTLTAADGVVPVDADVQGLEAGDDVSVELFSPSVRPPRVLVVGEDDPTLSRILDDVALPRYLSEGSGRGRRSLRDGVADVAVLAGSDATAVRDGTAGVDGVELAAWDRDWGLVVPSGNPEDVSGLADLVDRDLTFVNRDGESGLRDRLDDAIDDLAADRGTSRDALVESISGYGLETRGHESPARRVADGVVDTGLGLASTAQRLDLGFVPLGEDRLSVVAAQGRIDKPGVVDLEAVLDDVARD